jgi:putative hydrolase of the HAD superfamily
MLDYKKIKHFSFDLWFTLIRSNPAFKKERASYFHKNFNSLGKSLEEIEMVFMKMDLMCNAVNETTGKNVDADEIYLMIIYGLNNSLSVFGPINIGEIYNDIEKLVFQYMPQVYNAQTIESLDRIKQIEGNTMSILSNTAFIKGSTLRKVNEQVGLSIFFDFQIYSDEVGFSKPNQQIYSLMLNEISGIRKNNQASKNEIIHIGDNPVADIQGAIEAGVQAFQINTNDKLISSIFN